jgi:hypothetical protein
MKLKISNLIALQDARYSAAAGFDIVSFNLKKGDPRNLPVEAIREMAGWIAGPEIALELNTASMDQLDAAGESVTFRYISLPLAEWSPSLLNRDSGIILRAGATDAPSGVDLPMDAAADAGRELFVELKLAEAEVPANWMPLLSSLYLHFPSLHAAEQWLAGAETLPYGLSFYSEVEETPGCIDYPAMDDFLDRLRAR